jgi:flagellar biosynthesis/type III secretory pathway protein FliH
MSSFKLPSEENVASSEVTAYIPKDLNLEAEGKPVKSFDFIERQDNSGRSNFVIDSRISDHIGLTDAKNKEQQKQFDGEVLRYVQKIKDAAHQEAYEKGLQQGIEDAHAEAFAQAQKDLEEKTKSILEIIKSLTECRNKMLEVNEKEIIQFCYFMAEKIIYRELKHDPDLILNAIKTIATFKEEITVKISAADHLFIQDHLEKLAGMMNISAIRFEKDASLSVGDVIVESEQGLINGTLETRLKKMKNLLNGQE